MRYLLTSELFEDEVNYHKIFTFISLVAQKNFQIVFIEDEEKLEKLKEHFSEVVLKAILQKIQKDLKFFSSRKSNIFRVGPKNIDGFIILELFFVVKITLPNNNNKNIFFIIPPIF